MAKKRAASSLSSDNDGGVDHVVDVPAAAAGAGKGKKANVEGKTLPAERLLSDKKNSMQWSVIVETPETFANMVGFLKSLHTEITLFPTDRRRLARDADGNVIVDEKGNPRVVGFRGFAVDAMDPAQCLMTVARLTDRVSMNPASNSPEDLDRLPSVSARPEYSVTVETKTLHTMVRDVKAYESLAIYSEVDGCDMSIATSDASSESLNQQIRTRMSPSEHQTIGVLKYKYELSVPLDRMKTFVRRATELQATQVTLYLRSFTDTMWLFVVEADGEDGNMVRSLPIPHVMELPCGERKRSQVTGDAEAEVEAETEADGVGVAEAAAAVEDSGVSNGETSKTPREKYHADREERIRAVKDRADLSNNADMIGAMHAPNYAFLCASDNVVVNGTIPVRRKDFETLTLLYKGVFSTKYLSAMVKPLSGDSQLTLFLGGKEGEDADAPMVMRFDLGKTDSYVAYVLASKIDDD